MSFNAQELNQRILIQRQSRTRDPSSGDVLVNWVNVAHLWAKAEPLVGRELLAAQAVQAEKPVKFTLRWRDGLDASMRILWREDAYNIRSIADIKGKGREMLIHADGGVNDGR